MAEPRPGYRSTLTLEMVDPDGRKMSDLTWNVYGFEGRASEYEHNLIQTNLTSALAKEVKDWAERKVARPEQLELADLR